MMARKTVTWKHGSSLDGVHLKTLVVTRSKAITPMSVATQLERGGRRLRTRTKLIRPDGITCTADRASTEAPIRAGVQPWNLNVERRRNYFGVGFRFIEIGKELTKDIGK